MARLIDVSPEELQDGEDFIPLEDEQAPEEEQPAEPEEVQQAEEDDIPEKYQGKDIKDIVQMHQEAEKLLGKQSSEVGELRKIVDDFVKTQLDKANSPQQDEEKLDIFEDPDKYIEQKFANHPKIKAVEEISRSMRQHEIINKLQASHPDFNDIVNADNFKEWVAKSNVRIELFNRANDQFDYDAADELLTTWKERQNLVKETAEMQETDRKRQLKSASTGNANGSGEAPSRKIYRRADIIKLMQTDPKRYQALSNEIMAAYAEGRVK